MMVSNNEYCVVNINNYEIYEGKTPLFGTPDAGHFKRYSGCRELVRRMSLLEQTIFGCHKLKSKTYFRTKTVEIHQIIF